MVHTFKKTIDDHKLFRSDPSDWSYNCFPMKTLISDNNCWDRYADSYKLAADLLSGEKSARDWIFPVIFLYRHYFEIRLKYLIRVGNVLFDSSEDFPKQHKLKQLWPRAKIIITKLYPDSPKQDLLHLESCISELDKIDPSSMSFRYPEDKKGNFSVPDLGSFSLRCLSTTINKSSYILDGCTEEIERRLEWMAEQSRELEWEV